MKLDKTEAVVDEIIRPISSKQNETILGESLIA